MEALPEVGARKPVSIFMVVDLPAPLGPRNPSTSPGATLKDRLSTAVCCAKRLVRFVISIMASSPFGNSPWPCWPPGPCKTLADYKESPAGIARLPLMGKVAGKFGQNDGPRLFATRRRIRQTSRPEQSLVSQPHPVMTRSPFRRLAFGALRRLLYLWVR